MNAGEQPMDDGPFRGRGTVTLAEMRRAGIAVCIVTLLARSGPRHERQPRYSAPISTTPRAKAAYCACHAQLAYYRLMESRGELRLITTAAELDEHWRAWQDSIAHRSRFASPRRRSSAWKAPTRFSIPGRPGLLVGASALRAIGPAHYGYSHYSAGTAVEGGLTPDGVALLAGHATAWHRA